MFSTFLNIILTILKYLFIALAVTSAYLKVRHKITIKMCKSKARLDGKVVLITGGNTGIGLETARDLAKRGANVIIASRNEERSANAVTDIIATTGNKNVEYRHLDLGKFSSIRKFTEGFRKSYNRLDILINNSGTARLPYRLTEDGIETVSQVNYFGPFLLTNLLLDMIIASKPSRIIIVSSNTYIFGSLDLGDMRCERSRKPSYKIYPNTKLYNILWVKALARKVPEGVIVNALHPGLVNTDIFKVSIPLLNKLLVGYVGAIYKTPKEGAQTSIHLAVSEDVKDITGKYFDDCQVAKESKIAQNEDCINKVWEKSLLITNYNPVEKLEM